MKKGIISGLSMIAGAVAGAGVAGKIGHDKTDQMKKMADKHLALFLMMNQWVKVKQEGKTLVSYFSEHGYKTAAVYGMSHVGETLLNELKDSEIEILYGIDRNTGLYSYIDILTVNDPLPEVDVIVVTAITFFDEICELLMDKVSCPIVSMEDILYEI